MPCGKRRARLQRSRCGAVSDGAIGSDPHRHHPRPPEQAEIAAQLNQIALGLAAAFTALSGLRQALGVRERLEVQRRKGETE